MLIVLDQLMDTVNASIHGSRAQQMADDDMIRYKHDRNPLLLTISTFRGDGVY